MYLVHILFLVPVTKKMSKEVKTGNINFYFVIRFLDVPGAYVHTSEHFLVICIIVVSIQWAFHSINSIKILFACMRHVLHGQNVAFIFDRDE